MMVKEKTFIKTIDLTPTWASIMPVLMAGLTDGNETARRVARQELMRLAAFADAVNASKPKPLGQVLGATENVGN